MRILRLDLARFGHFAGQTLDFAADRSRLAIVHGPNEAGKTTVLEAIRCLLFGFPERSARFAVGVDQTALRVGAVLEFANGKRVKVERRKGRGDTLDGHMIDGGDDISDDWLHGRLSRPNRALFENIFGFSLEMLARGAESLADENLKTAIYGAGFGGAIQPARILSDLQKEKDSLFKDAGKSKPRITARMVRLEELRKETRSATVSADEFNRLTDGLAKKEAALAESDAQMKTLRGRMERARAVLAGLEPHHALIEAQAELDALRVPDGFPDDGAHAYPRLVEARERLLREKAAQEEARTALESELRGLVIDRPILDAESEIDGLYRGLDAYAKALADKPKRASELELLRRRTAKDLSDIRPGWDLERLRAARFDTATRAEFEVALDRDDALRAEVARVERDIRSLEDSLGAASRMVATSPTDESALALGAWLEGWPAFVAAREQMEECDKRLGSLTRKRDALRLELDPPCKLGDLEPESLRVPPLEEVNRFDQELEALDRQAERIDDQMATKELELEGVEGELSRLEAAGLAPSEEDLGRSRARREEGWRLVLRALQSEPVDGAASVLFDPALPLPRAYERAVSVADDIADRMRARADLVQQRALRESAKARLLSLLNTLRERGGQLAVARADFTDRWRAAWAPSRFAPLTPAAMRAWLTHRQALVDVVRDLGEEHPRRVELTTRVERYLEEGRALSGARSQTAERMHADATRRFTAETERQKAEASLQARRERDQALLEAAKVRQLGLGLEAEEWLQTWCRMTTALGLGDSVSVAGARKVVSGLVELRQGFALEEESLLDRIGKMAADIEHYEGRVERARASTLATLGGTPFSMVEKLKERLDASRDAERTLRMREKALGAAEEQLAFTASQLESTMASLAHLRDVAGVSDDEGFAHVAKDAARKERLQAKIGESERMLRQQLRGVMPYEAYLAELASSVGGGQSFEVARLEREEEAQAEEDKKLQQAAWEERARLKTIDGGAVAADARALVETERAALREDIDRYAVLALAEEILQASIRNFEREHQPEVLAKTSQVFASMTEDRYRRVERRLDGSLFLERRDGSQLTPEVLSTGTREQLHLAIRLAYVAHYGKSAEALPIVLDDVLVNFDDARGAATLAALAAFAAETQVLLFTCHAHLRDLADAAKIDVAHLSIPGIMSSPGGGWTS